MIFRQFIDEDLAAASYLVGDERSGVAAVIDPCLEYVQYLDAAAAHRVRIRHIIETHTHADHVSGHGLLAASTSARIHIHRDAAAAYDHEPIEHGWRLELGAVAIQAVHTPGHRPEHTAFVLTDQGRSPWAVLTGDSLLVGDVARPDLAIDARAGARALYRSLHDHLLSLPGACEVWPGHLGGSLCAGAAMSRKPASTIGYERAHNPLLRDDENAFIDRLVSSLPLQPPNLHAIVELNRGRRITERLVAHPRNPEEVAEGAFLVDVRSELEYDSGHIPGSLCLPVASLGFGTRLAQSVPLDADVIFVALSQAEVDAAVLRAAGVGFVRRPGWIGITDWPRALVRTSSIGIDDLRARLERGEQLQVIDVREPDEYRAGHLDGALNSASTGLAQAPKWLDDGRTFVVMCATGRRAALGASLLSRHGARHVLRVADGGVTTWAERGWPLVRE